MQSYRWQLCEKNEQAKVQEIFSCLRAVLADYPAANQYAFIQPVLETFFAEHDYVYAVLWCDTEPVFILPVVKYRCRKFAAQWWEIGFPFHSHVNLLQLPQLMAQGSVVYSALLRALEQRFTGWSRFAVRHIQNEAIAAEYAGDVAWFDVHGRNLAEIVSKKHLRNVLRLENRLKETGQELRFAFYGHDLPAALAAFAELELNSWKGDDGVAILNNAATGDFYRRLSEQDMAGSMRIAALCADDVLIAGTIGFVCGSTLYIHKISYHNAYAEYAPGNLIVLQILNMALADEHIKTVNFVTRPGWINRWHPQISHVYNQVFYPANLRGQILRRLVFNWRRIKPRIKSLLRMSA